MVLLSLAQAACSDDATHKVAPYEAAHDAPLEAHQTVIAQTDGYQQFRVEFHGIKGDRVPAFLYVPDQPSRKGEGSGLAKCRAVLLQYGIGGNKTTDYIVAIGRQFVARGFVVLTIDAPLRGERAPKEKKNASGALGDFARDIFVQTCGDYSRAVDYLVTRPEVDAERIGYVGISWGAITGVTYVAHDSRIKVMGSMVGGGNFGGLLGPAADPNGNGPPPIDPVHHVGRIAPRPLLMLNVTKDQLVPRQFAEALHQAAGKGAEVRWLETDHFFSDVDRREVAESVIEFMEENLPARDRTP
jgi:dienelactone hydrolase